MGNRPAFWSPDGRKLLFSSWVRGGTPGMDKLWVLGIQPVTGQVLDTTQLPLPAEIHSASWSAWSPDGKEIAIEDKREGGNRALWIVHADGTHGEKLLDYRGTTYDGLDGFPTGKPSSIAAFPVTSCSSSRYLAPAARRLNSLTTPQI